ncbi:hypothetical protein [Nocardia abscessus]|uniref:hypothetical protein n=1 Tax=Nocardia abscessus TaxID=120957 RepID=UPI002457A605|nr:hypothetical protein [Nocardia abscessus]
MLINPHCPRTQTVQRIIQRIPRQILIVHRQPTTSIREISLRICQFAPGRIPLSGQTRTLRSRLGTHGLLGRTHHRFLCSVVRGLVGFPGGLREGVIQPSHFILGIEYLPGSVLESSEPVLPRPLLIDPHRASTQLVQRVIQRIPRQFLVVDRQTTASIREICPRVRQLLCYRIPLGGQAVQFSFGVGTCRLLGGCLRGRRIRLSGSIVRGRIGGSGSLIEGIVQSSQFRVRIEHAACGTFQLRNPVLPRTLLIDPHRAAAQTLERIVQRIPRQVLVVHRQTTASIREISLRVRHFARRRVPLRGQALQVGAGGALDEVGEGCDVRRALDDFRGPRGPVRAAERRGGGRGVGGV